MARGWEIRYNYLPDRKVCRTEHFNECVSYCLVTGPFRCPYARGFGARYYCANPQRRRFEVAHVPAVAIEHPISAR